MGIVQGCVLQYRHMSTLACLIICIYTVSSIIYSDIYQRKHQAIVLLILLEGSPLVSGGFTSQRASKNNGHHMFPYDHIIYNRVRPITSFSIGRDWRKPCLCQFPSTRHNSTHMIGILQGCVLQYRHMSTLACLIICIYTVSSIIYSDIYQRKHQAIVLLILLEGSPLVSGGFTSQRASKNNGHHMFPYDHIIYNRVRPITSFSIGRDWRKPCLCQFPSTRHNSTHMIGILQGCVLQYRHMSTLACLIICIYTVSSIIYSDIYQRKHQAIVLLILLEGSPLVSGGFTSQRASKNNGHHMFPYDHIIYNRVRPITSFSIGRDWRKPCLCQFPPIRHNSTHMIGILQGCVLQYRHMSTLACQNTGTNSVFHLFRPISMKTSSIHATDPSWGDSTGAQRIHPTKGQQHRKCFRVMILYNGADQMTSPGIVGIGQRQVCVLFNRSGIVAHWAAYYSNIIRAHWRVKSPAPILFV